MKARVNKVYFVPKSFVFLQSQAMENNVDFLLISYAVAI
jgi:hypothetical protein